MIHGLNSYGELRKNGLRSPFDRRRLTGECYSHKADGIQAGVNSKPCVLTSREKGGTYCLKLINLTKRVNIMKPYKIILSVSVIEEKPHDWENVEKIDFTISEKVPHGVDPVIYLRSRLSEEVKRHSPSAGFDWKVEGQDYDDLATGDSVPVPTPNA